MDKGKLAEKVLQWATDECHYGKDGQKRPNVLHVQRLCVGNMIPVWQFLLTHVKSEEEVQKIRGNLLLDSKTQQRGEEEARMKLTAQRDSMRAALAEANANIAKLQLDLATLKSSVETEENKQSNIVRNIRERETRNTLLESHDRSQAVAANIMREYQARILQVISHLKNHPLNNHPATNIPHNSHSTTPFPQNSHSTNQKVISTRDPTSIYSSPHKPVLETNSTRLVREICEFIKDAYERHLTSQEIDAIVKDRLKDIFGTQGVRANEVMETLEQLALTMVKSCEELKKETGVADYKGGRVAELLFHLRAAHAERFFRTLELRNKFSSHPNVVPAGAAHLSAHATQLRRMHGTLHGMRAALRVVNDRIAELQGEIENGLHSSIDERVTQARVVLSRSLRIRGENAREVMRLRAENIGYMSKINEARQIMGEIVKANISPKETELLSARDSFSLNAKLEIETLTKLDVTKSLPATLGRNKDVKEEGILSAIKSLNDSGPESLLQKLFAAKVQLENAVQQVEYERRSLEAFMNGPISVSVNNSKAISTIEKINENFMEGQRQLAMQQRALQKEAEQAVSKAVTTRQGADTWWQQPAQYHVPWITLDGRSLEDYVKEWRSLCSVLDVK